VDGLSWLCARALSRAPGTCLLAAAHSNTTLNPLSCPSLPPYLTLPILCSIELVRHSGRRLRQFSLAQCDGGPHEFRGVRRSNLLASANALSAAAVAASVAIAAAVPGI
jgi:hypothetical protein